MSYNTIIDTVYMTVSIKDETILLDRKDYTSHLNDDGFKSEALTFINIVQEKNIKKIIVDMRNFNYQLNNELIARRNTNIIDIYNKIWVDKFAFIIHQSENTQSIKQDDAKNSFKTQTFISINDAEKRLTVNVQQ